MAYGQSTKLFFDGGCRPNPGPIECAVVRKGVTHYRHDLGNGSNSDAEWLAAIHALEVAAMNGDRDITLIGDSTLVVTQAKGTARCCSVELEAHRVTFEQLAIRFDRLRIRHIGRAQNLAGIALAKLHPR
ncbi:reverse transcriptase-like protein [Sphingomonas sp. CFBP 13728]|uniref:reverse transcriptase-like protein n=1 Tax=Sphingomonas sp. CFBP 13728 TaxID=2775294 RepID=UPI001780F9F3|nr:reverse transcriptase-like protein [Sphingomonas sp. CFBP 13728]MBD8619830.1 reverse transcriptase-like protein [Sphingomonas sp. CFBP 13728]